MKAYPANRIAVTATAHQGEELALRGFFLLVDSYFRVKWIVEHSSVTSSDLLRLREWATRSGSTSNSHDEVIEKFIFRESGASQGGPLSSGCAVSATFNLCGHGYVGSITIDRLNLDR
jgi:hypothetical protein